MLSDKIYDIHYFLFEKASKQFTTHKYCTVLRKIFIIVGLRQPVDYFLASTEVKNNASPQNDVGDFIFVK